MATNKGSWAVTQEAMENQGGGLFLKLENDGDTAVLAFCGAPLPRHTAYDEKTNKSESWDESKHTLGQRRTKYLINAYVLSFNGTAVDEMKIVDLSFKTLTTVIALKDKYGFGKMPFEIKRDGAKGDKKTVYHILPENRELTDDERAKFGHVDPSNIENWIEGTVPLNDLDKAGSDDGEGTAVTSDVKKNDRKSAAAGKTTNGANGTAHAPAAGGAAPLPPAASAPAAAGASPQTTITKEVFTQFIERLKPLDPAKGVKPFLAAFPYAKKVSDIRVSDEQAARTLVDKLTAPVGAPAGDDPFA